MTFRWKDYAHGNRQRLMTLDAVEFIRRFLLHILPAGFQRLRHYGLRANRGRQAKLRLCRVLLQPPVSATRTVPPDPQAPPAPDQPAAVCPACQRGRMSWVETLHRQPDLFARWMQPPGWNTSSQDFAMGRLMGRPHTSLWRRARRGANLRRATYALSPPWCAVLASASAWLAPSWCEPPWPTPWEHPARRVLRRFTPSQLLRGCKQSPEPPRFVQALLSAVLRAGRSLTAGLSCLRTADSILMSYVTLHRSFPPTVPVCPWCVMARGLGDLGFQERAADNVTCAIIRWMLLGPHSGVTYARHEGSGLLPDPAHGWEGATLVAPATGVASDDWPARPCPAHPGGAAPVTLRRRGESTLLRLVGSATS